MSEIVLVALIVAVPPTLTGIAALITSLRVHKEVKTLNGMTLAQLAEANEERSKGKGAL